MPAKLSVLAVGSIELTDLVRDSLLLHHRSHLSVASDFWQLCSLSLCETLDISVAVLELSVSDRELRRRAEQIKRRWPDAAILLFGRNSRLLNDSLYDQRVPPQIHLRELLDVIEHMAEMSADREWPGATEQRDYPSRIRFLHGIELRRLRRVTE